MKNTQEKASLLTLLILMPMNLQLFDEPFINVSTATATGNDLSPQMRKFYSDYLIDYAKVALYHNQFGQKHPIPKRGGKTIEFRVKKPFPKALTPLQEGVTPTGHALDWGKLEATVSQYGDYVTVTDVLEHTAVDSQIAYATENNGDQAGRTLDTLTREVLNGGTSVQYAAGQVVARYQLVGGSSNPANNHYLTVDCIRRGVRFLKVMNARPVSGGDYVAIIHPDISYDLMNDPAWQNVKDYDPADWYNGEIGRIAGVRFVETSEAKIFHAEDLTSTNRNLTIAETLTTAGKTVKVKEDVTDEQAAALVGRKILIAGKQYTVKAATAKNGSTKATITVEDADPNISTTDGAENTVIYPGEAGAEGRDVYSTLIFGADAYGVTEIEGMGLEFIYKPLGSAGTADPLNQRATAGWKATHVAKRLVETFMLRIETASTFQSGAN